jgi:hypothetical protein
MREWANYPDAAQGRVVKVWRFRLWTLTGRDVRYGGLEHVVGEAGCLGAAIARGGVRTVDSERECVDTHYRRQDSTHQKISAMCTE